ncbi:hypothetical protein BR93DRAFT_161217 [Coniochaeta sp. PMI_546]|nr:hypothetical protein BR93DRAFT_161217 [Coniochaeta sp. PMI_546]
MGTWWAAICVIRRLRLTTVVVHDQRNYSQQGSDYLPYEVSAAASAAEVYLVSAQTTLVKTSSTLSLTLLSCVDPPQDIQPSNKSTIVKLRIHGFQIYQTTCIYHMPQSEPCPPYCGLDHVAEAGIWATESLKAVGNHVLLPCFMEVRHERMTSAAWRQAGGGLTEAVDCHSSVTIRSRGRLHIGISLRRVVCSAAVHRRGR